MAQFTITSTGSTTTMVFPEWGNRTFTHPVSAFDIIPEFSFDEIIESTALRGYLDDGSITAAYEGIAITTSAQLDSVATEGGLAGIQLRLPTGAVTNGAVWVYDSASDEYVLKTLGSDSLPPDITVVEFYDTSEDESSTNSDVFQNKLTVTHPIALSGFYTVDVYFEVRSSASNKNVAASILADAVEFVTYETDTDLYQGNTGFIRLTKTTGQNIDVVVRFRRIANGTSALIRRVRIKITRIG